MNRRIIIMMSAIILSCYLGHVCELKAYASDISLLYDNIYSISTSLSFSNNNATCSVSIMGKSDTEKISGTLKLYDNTNCETVKTWNVNNVGTYYSTSKVVAVKSGHSYTLSFSGYVSDENGESEYISDFVEKKN